ncbi:DMT family transporter [Rhizobium grahamii]|uniref:EamA family transporter n=1 Tax=Rhizobium grahamii TaxID=1120045 RepID=A0A370KGN2_9HYPH|nr:DMT family transporter [Rhizobium grahamii]RDJ03926.1 EamA family transporter [Rhizobium grahamii]
MLVYEFAAFGAAVCWALAGLFSAKPARHFGAMRFNSLKLISVSLVLLVEVLVTGSWRQLDINGAFPLLLSGLIGIFAGDTILYSVLIRLGPRRTGVLFAMNAPMSAVLGWALLGETISPVALTGIALVTIGVVIAILYGKRSSQQHPWEAIQGPLWIAIGLGLLAALAQAAGSILARPVMQGGMDPVLASLLRVGVSAACLTVISQLPFAARSRPRFSWQSVAMTACSGLLSMALGMTLLLFALSGGNVGIVSTLSATTPVLVLPMIWAVTRERPAFGAWIGAGTVFMGMAVIFAT